MSATKYVPVNMFGGPAPDPVGQLFYVDSDRFIFTEVIASNTDDNPRKLTLFWAASGGNPVYLFDEVSMPPKSVMNLNLYLPLDLGAEIKGGADQAGSVFLTLNGQELQAL